MFTRANPPRYAVFAGAGQRGLAYAGVLCNLKTTYVLELCAAVLGAAGTSIGAFFALLVTCGFTSKEILAELTATPMSELLSLNIGLLYSSYGMDDGVRLEAFVNRLLFKKLNMVKPTLKQLYDRTLRTFIAVATDMGLYKPVYLSASTHPDMTVSRAVAISMAIPPVFCPFKHGALTLVDGGFVDNFPMHLFPPDLTVGFRTQWNAGFSLDGFEQYFGRLCYCAMAASEAAMWEKLAPEVKARIVTIPTGNVTTIDLRLTEDEKKLIIETGRGAVLSTIFSIVGGITTSGASTIPS